MTMTPNTDSVAVLREKHIADLQFLRNDCGPDEPYAAALDAAIAALSAHGEEPVAWIRFCSDGGYEGPILDSRMEDVRKQSGAWTPLYLHPAPPVADAGRPTDAEIAREFWKRWTNARLHIEAACELQRMHDDALAARTGKGEANGR